MKSEDMKELKELIEFLKENNIGEFDLERGELKIRIKFAQESGADLAGLARLVAIAGSTGRDCACAGSGFRSPCSGRDHASRRSACRRDGR